jgi:hypothetical protein
LAQYGNAVLLLPTPRWEKQAMKHVQEFWLNVIIPMIGEATHVEFVASSPFSRGAPAPEQNLKTSLAVEAPTEFAGKWFGAITSGELGDSYLLLGVTDSALRSSSVFARAASVGYFDKLKKRFSRPVMAAIDRGLASSEYVFGVGPPPFGSAFVVARKRGPEQD